MADLLPPLLITCGLLVAVAAFALLARHVRRRGTAGTAVASALAAWEEAYRVTSHEAHWEVKAQAERQAPVLSPDGHWQPRGYGAGRAGGRPARPSRLRRLLRRS
ncbi:hypothetical protein ACIO3O_13350 [Streptomyces sp. NPDC087440]|uniref:hypothetical protein n=1 Tax=Streptomyces sp. NPDC087440 TaxID=3365790 RepID=UPI0037F65636